MTSNHTHSTAHATDTVDAVEMPSGLADPEMRIYAAFVGVLAGVVPALFCVPGIG